MRYIFTYFLESVTDKLSKGVITERLQRLFVELHRYKSL